MNTHDRLNHHCHDLFQYDQPASVCRANNRTRLLGSPTDCSIQFTVSDLSYIAFIIINTIINSSNSSINHHCRCCPHSLLQHQKYRKSPWSPGKPRGPWQLDVPGQRQPAVQRHQEVRHHPCRRRGCHRANSRRSNPNISNYCFVAVLSNPQLQHYMEKLFRA